MNCFRRWTLWTVVVICESTRRRKAWMPTRQFTPGSPPLSLQQLEGPYRFFKIYSTHSCTCICRGISIAPSRRMLETLLMDEDSLLLTVARLKCYLNLQCCALYFMELFFVRFFSASDFFSLVVQQFFELLHISRFSGLFHGSATLTLKLFLLTSVLSPCILVDQIQIFGTCKS